MKRNILSQEVICALKKAVRRQVIQFRTPIGYLPVPKYSKRTRTRNKTKG